MELGEWHGIRAPAFKEETKVYARVLETSQNQATAQDRIVGERRGEKPGQTS